MPRRRRECYRHIDDLTVFRKQDVGVPQVTAKGPSKDVASRQPHNEPFASCEYSALFALIALSAAASRELTVCLVSSA